MFVFYNSNNSIHYSKLKLKKIRMVLQYNIQCKINNTNIFSTQSMSEEILIIFINENQLLCEHSKFEIYTIEVSN